MSPDSNCLLVCIHTSFLIRMFISFHAGLLYAAGCTLRTATARPVCISSVQCGGNLAQVGVYTGMARQRRDLSMTAMKISPIPSQRRECQINGVIFTKVVFLLVMALLSSRPLSLSTHAALSVFIVACHFTGRSEKQIVADNTRGLNSFLLFFQMWNDYKLQWDPREYDGIEFVRVPADKIWKPDIVLYNKYDEHFPILPFLSHVSSCNVHERHSIFMVIFFYLPHLLF